jgi:flagellar biosynthesis/type III secretory pathway protein FliH
MRPLSMRLENFGDPRRGGDAELARAVAAAAAAARGEGHAAGYAEGFAAGMAQADADDRAAVAAARESLRDLELRQQGARAEAVAALGPVIAAIARAAAPHAAEAGFEAALAETVAARLTAAPADRPVIRCAPARVEGLSARFGDAVTLRPDPALGPADARVEWTSGGAWFDASQALAAAEAAIAEFFGVAAAIAARETARDAG